MRKALHMFAALAGIALASGLILGGVHQATAQRAADNILRFKKVPAVVAIHEGQHGKLSPEKRLALQERLLAETRLVDLGEKDSLTLFVLSDQGTPRTVALEAFGQGFGGDLGVMVGIDLASEDLAGIGITTMSETPGLGTRVRDSTFTRQFAGMSKDATFKVKKDGGEIDAVTGATVSSRAVAAGVEAARAAYQANKAAIQASVNQAPASANTARNGETKP